MKVYQGIITKKAKNSIWLVEKELKKLGFKISSSKNIHSNGTDIDTWSGKRS